MQQNEKNNRPEENRLQPKPSGLDKYREILCLPHHVSKTRKPMSMDDRAAQFAPFAALVGFDEIIDDTAKENTAAVLAAEKGEEFTETI